ncbi:MAG: QueT transporter family protein [Ruminococcaceae bacterium]|nr:QueT transporter family protein [Oscillospiraceae bacterium]
METTKKRPLRYLTEAGIVGGMYAALCLVFAPISYGVIQVRVAEVLTVLPAFMPSSVAGLTVGCLIANLLSGGAVGAWDWLFGTLATLVAALASRALRRVTVKGLPWLSALPPVLFNAVVVGAECAWAAENAGLFWLYALQVAAGQTVACVGGGLLLAGVLRKSKLYKGVLL